MRCRTHSVRGTWKELTDNVNQMVRVRTGCQSCARADWHASLSATQARNLTDQVRSIATVTKAVADGDLSKKIEVDAMGEILDLKLTVNSMVDFLRIFAAEVTRVARDVGTNGQLGGQARVVNVGGEWRNLTDLSLIHI